MTSEERVKQASRRAVENSKKAQTSPQDNALVKKVNILEKRCAGLEKKNEELKSYGDEERTRRLRLEKEKGTLERQLMSRPAYMRDSTRDLIQSGMPFPCDHATEMVVLGTALTYPQHIREFENAGITFESFHKREHQKIWDTISCIDPDFTFQTLGKRLDDGGALEECGGRYYLAQLMSDAAIVPQSLLVREIPLLLATQAKRKIIAESLDLINDLFQKEQEHWDCPQKALENVSIKIDEVTTKLRETVPLMFRGDRTTADLVDFAVKENEIATEQRYESVTGYSNLDAFTNGLKPGEVVLCSGPSESGLTSLALNVAWNVQAREGNVLFLNSKDRRTLSHRLVSLVLAKQKKLIASDDLRMGRVKGKRDRQNIAVAYQLIKDSGLDLRFTRFDRANLELSVRDACREANKETESYSAPDYPRALRLVVVDDLDEVKGEQFKNDSWVVSELVKDLRAIAEKEGFCLWVNEKSGDRSQGGVRRAYRPRQGKSDAIHQEAINHANYRIRLYNPQVAEEEELDPENLDKKPPKTTEIKEERLVLLPQSGRFRNFALRFIPACCYFQNPWERSPLNKT